LHLIRVGVVWGLVSGPGFIVDARWLAPDVAADSSVTR
jgi:hypothetical protein